MMMPTTCRQPTSRHQRRPVTAVWLALEFADLGGRTSLAVVTISELLETTGPTEAPPGDHADDDEDEDGQRAREAVLLHAGLEGHGVDHRDQDVRVAHDDR